MNFFGVWENNKYIGVVIYGSGANADLVKPYGFTQTEGCELVRVALTTHKAPVSQIIAESLRQLKKSNPDLRLVVSFADPDQNHKGGIYQAGNWIYAGKSQPSEEYVVNGKRWQGRSLRSSREGHKLGAYPAKNVLEWAQKVLDPKAYVVMGSSKHRYLYPLDKQTRRKVEKLSQPYPSAIEVSR